MRTVICFVRPHLDSGCKAINKVIQESSMCCLSIGDHKGVDDCQFVKLQQRYFNDGSAEGFFKKIGSYEEIVYRDRYLSNISFHLAKRLINSAWLAVKFIFMHYRVKYFIGYPPDNYILHLIDIFCKTNGIKSINPIVSFLPGLIRMTTVGEHIKVREVSDKEISRYLSLFKEKLFAPGWLNRNFSKYDMVRIYVKERIKKIYFKYKKIFTKDPYSFHYNTIFPLEKVITVRGLSNIFVDKFLVKDKNYLNEKIKKYSNVVLLPLQVAPETSLNYFIKDYRFIDYPSVIFKIIDSIPDGTVLLIKEHPNFYGYRDYDFYKQFHDKSNVILIHPSIPVNYLFDSLDLLVVTGNASTGAEAVLKGINVVSLGGAFYSDFSARCINIEHYFDIYKLNGIIKNPKAFFLHEEFDERKYMKNILEGTVHHGVCTASNLKRKYTKEDFLDIIKYLENSDN